MRQQDLDGVAHGGRRDLDAHHDGERADRDRVLGRQTGEAGGTAGVHQAGQLGGQPRHGREQRPGGPQLLRAVAGVQGGGEARVQFGQALAGLGGQAEHLGHHPQGGRDGEVPVQVEPFTRRRERLAVGRLDPRRPRRERLGRQQRRGDLGELGVRRRVEVEAGVVERDDMAQQGVVPDVDARVGLRPLLGVARGKPRVAEDAGAELAVSGDPRADAALVQALFAGTRPVVERVVVTGAQDHGEGIALGAEDELHASDGQQMPAQLAVGLIGQHDTVLERRRVKREEAGAKRHRRR